jgi:hypothetical protein
MSLPRTVTTLHVKSASTPAFVLELAVTSRILPTSIYGSYYKGNAPEDLCVGHKLF